MTDPIEVALKLMGIREQCEFCEHWGKRTDPNFGWCEKKDDGKIVCYLDKCPDFIPNTLRRG